MRLCLLLWLSLLCGVVNAQDAITGFAGAPANPQTPGFHKLVYNYTDEGKPYQLCFMLYLPPSYNCLSPTSQPATQLATRPASQPATQPTEPFPMLVFLSGLGERGSDPQMMLAGGVAHDLMSRPEVFKWLPMIMVGPQCPADSRYEDARIGKAITSLIDEISKRYLVDTRRRYLTGFSMGGTGCWSVARFAKDRFAVVAPVVPRIFEPQVLSEALAGTGTTCLVISGEVDAKSEPGSSEMVKALRRRDVDVVYAMIPKGDHNIWSWYFRDKRFYEWLLLHRQGQPKPANRMNEAEIIAMAKERSNNNEQFLKRMETELQGIAPWWHIDNIAFRGGLGMCKQVNGKEKVFVTMPYYYDEAPCRLQTTTRLPKGDNVTLHLVVGRHPQGSWKLIVRVNEQEVISSAIDQKTTPELWKTIDVNLTPWAGQEVRLQVCQAGLNSPKNGMAYWQTIQILPAP